MAVILKISPLRWEDEDVEKLLECVKEYKTKKESSDMIESQVRDVDNSIKNPEDQGIISTDSEDPVDFENVATQPKTRTERMREFLKTRRNKNIEKKSPNKKTAKQEMLDLAKEEFQFKKEFAADMKRQDELFRESINGIQQCFDSFTNMMSENMRHFFSMTSASRSFPNTSTPQTPFSPPSNVGHHQAQGSSRFQPYPLSNRTTYYDESNHNLSNNIG